MAHQRSRLAAALQVFHRSKSGGVAFVIDVASLIALAVALVVTTVVLFSYA